MQSRRRSHPEALLVDGLGTLVRLHPPAPLLVAELGRRFDVSVSEVQARRALAAEIAYYRAHMGSGADADSLASLRHECATMLRAALPPAAAGLDVRAVTEALLASLRFSAYPDAARALRRARSAGARVVVVSNWDVSLLEVLERSGLAALLHGAVTSAAVGAGKPAPAIFRHALELAGVPARQARHVGDSPSQDVAGAAACGIPAVLIDRAGPAQAGVGGQAATVTDAHGESGEVPVIASLDELTWPGGP